MAFEQLQAGDLINSDSLERMARGQVPDIIAGPGIEIKRLGNGQILISAVGARGGTGTADFYWADYTGP